MILILSPCHVWDFQCPILINTIIEIFSLFLFKYGTTYYHTLSKRFEKLLLSFPFFLFGYFFWNICSANSHFFFIIFKTVYWKLQHTSDLNLSDLFHFEFIIFKTLVFKPENEKLQSLERIKGWASSIEGAPFFANFSICPGTYLAECGSIFYDMHANSQQTRT